MTSSQLTSRCPYCGSALEPIVLPALLGAQERIVGYRTCSCKAARAAQERQRLDELSAKQEREYQAAKKRYAAAGIKPRYFGATSELARGLIASMERGKGAYLFGNVGTGKTHLASAIAKASLDLGKRVRMVDMPSIVARVKSTFGSSETEDDVLLPLMRYDLLIIDDLGKEAPTDWTLTQVFRIINSRYENLKPVVITSQYDFKALGARLSRNGDTDTALAIVSRLSEMCQKIELKGHDRRLTYGKR